MKCPTCSAEASGKFCSECGATLTSIECPSCGGELKAGSRFCNLCGHALGAGSRDRIQRRWIIAGGVLAALAAVLLVRMTASSRAPGEAPAVASPTMTDISNMTPRERADRLFNRVMTASEQGDSGQVAFFGNMALQAYDLLGGYDADARYHVGMMHLALRNLAAARAQADSITRTAKGHLLASHLRAEVGRRANDTAARNRAWRELLANYDAEMASGKPEYGDHRTALENARAEARKAVGTPAP
jgi:hypothetical protein